MTDDGKPKIIAVVGMPGSGKGTITNHLQSKGYKVIHFGQMVYDEVEKRGLNIVRDEKSVRMDMRQKDGLAVMAMRATEKAEDYFSKGEETVVFDGLYSWSEYKFLENKYGLKMLVIAVVADKKLRHQYALRRDDPRRRYTLEELISREVAEIEKMEKGGPIAYADHYLLNNGSLEKLIQNFDKLLADLGFKLS